MGKDDPFFLARDRFAEPYERSRRWLAIRPSIELGVIPRRYPP